MEKDKEVNDIDIDTSKEDKRKLMILKIIIGVVVIGILCQDNTGEGKKQANHQ